MPTIEKYYLWKVYRNGRFLGCLPVKDPFGFTQDVNSAGPNQLNVELVLSADVSGLPPDPILDENGDTVLDEAGNTVYAERATEVVGNSNGRIMARNGNLVKVYEYSDRYPNGKCMFNGKIKNWKGVWGKDGTIKLVIYPVGDELENSPLVGSSYTSDQSQTSQASVYNGIAYGKDAIGAAVWQSFTVGAGVTNLAAIDLKIGAYTSDDIGKTVDISIHASQAAAQSGATPLATGQIILTSTSLAVKKAILSSAIEVTESDVRYVRIQGTSGTFANFILGYQNSNPYANGQAKYADGSNGVGNYGVFFTLGTSADIYFVTYSTGGETTAVFTNADPTDDIIKTAMDNYIGAGGSVAYDNADIQATGESIDYTFIGATVYAGIAKALEMCPSGYYWTVDSGTNKLTVKQMSDTADFTVVKGIHVSSLELSASIENVKNDIPFSGGLVAGVNLYKRYHDETSISEWGRGYDPQSDNRVTIENTMDQLGTTRLAIAKDEQYQTALTLLDSEVDITQYKPGMTIGFAGFGPTIDSLVLMIVSLQYSPNAVTLSLGTLPPRTVVTLEQINRELEALQTIDNPDAPS